MATPTIEAIAVQHITVNTDYELGIGITGDPEEVTVGGIITGFYYSWDASADTLTIAGNAERLIADVVWTVNAKETPSSTAVTREITYSVVLGAPIIADIGEFDVPQGPGFSHQIDIANRPTTLRVNGLILGWKYDPNEDGVEIYGDLPEDANFTVGSGEIEVIAENDGGMDTATGAYILTEFLEGGFWGYNAGDDEVYHISIPLSAEVESELLKTGFFPGATSYISIAYKDLTLYMYDLNGSTDLYLDFYAADFEDQDGLTSTERLSFPYFPSRDGFVDVEYVAVTDTHLWFATDADTIEKIPIDSEYFDFGNSSNVGKDRIYADVDNNLIYTLEESRSDRTLYYIHVYSLATENATTVSLIKTFQLEITGNYHAIAVDNGTIYALDAFDDRIDLYNTNTDNNAIATRQSFFNLDSNFTFRNGMSIEGNIVYLVQRISGDRNNVYLVDKNTANDTTATLIRSFESPLESSSSDIISMSSHNGNLYQMSDRGVYVFAENTANGTIATLIEYFDVPYRSQISGGHTYVGLHIQNNRIYHMAIGHTGTGGFINYVYNFPVDDPTRTIYDFGFTYVSIDIRNGKLYIATASEFSGDLYKNYVRIYNESDFSEVATITLPRPDETSGSTTSHPVSSVVSIGENLHALFHSGEKIYTVNESTGDLVEEHDLPSDITDLTVDRWSHT